MHTGEPVAMGEVHGVRQPVLLGVYLDAGGDQKGTSETGEAYILVNVYMTYDVISFH